MTQTAMQLQEEGVKTVEFKNHENENIAIIVTGKAEIDVKQFAITPEQIEEFKSKVNAITITSLDDKAAYEEAYAIRQRLKKWRTSNDKIADILVEGAKEYTRTVNDEKNKFSKLFKEVEAICLSKEEAYEKLKEEKAMEEERLREELEQNRCSALIDLGMTFNGKYYTIESGDGNVSIEHNKVSSYTIPQWTSLIETIKPIAEAIAERKQREAERQAEIEAENKRMREELERRDSRIKQLISIGLVYDGENFLFEDVNVHDTELIVLNDTEWNVLIERVGPVVTERKAAIKLQEEEKARKEQEEKERVASLRRARTEALSLYNSNASLMDLASMSDQEWDSLIKSEMQKYEAAKVQQEKAALRETRARETNKYLPYMKADQIFDGDFAEMTEAAFDQYLTLCVECKKVYDQEQEELRRLAELKRKEDEERIEREKKAEQEAKAAAIAPDIEKLQAVAARLRDITIPELGSVNSQQIVLSFNEQREKFAAWIESLANRL
jgi:hypothetical protein